ncbi:MAG: hypothetical protein ACE5G8_11390 [Anaerolineae bacterium]
MTYLIQLPAISDISRLPSAHRTGQKKTIVAIARKLLVVIWHVLTAAETDRRADADKVAGKLMLWAWQIGQQQ